jgi:peptidoglycan/LPS O-acetylase OafA/YrhL
VKLPEKSVVPDSTNLDLLRAVAVLCVFFAHLILCLADTGHYRISDYPFWKLQLGELGHVGVLFFFVHTALVLMMSLERTASRRLVLNFYIRRMFRIYPLSVTCIAAVLLFHIPAVPDGKFVSWSWDQIVANLFLVQNIFQKDNVLAPLWTLPRELQMYLVLPFLYFLLRRFSSSLVVILLWTGSFALLAGAVTVVEEGAHGGLPSLQWAAPLDPLLASFPCFMGGVFAYQLGKERTFAMPALVWPASVAILLGLHVGSMMLGDANLDRSDFVLCMFLGAVIPNVVNLKKSWVTSACHAIAKYSFGIYLCHDPVLWFSFVKLGWLPVVVQWTALVLLMTGIPIAAYSLLEAPMIGIGRRIAAWCSAFGTTEPLKFPVATAAKGI